MGAGVFPRSLSQQRKKEVGQISQLFFSGARRDVGGFSVRLVARRTPDDRHPAGGHFTGHGEARCPERAQPPAGGWGRARLAAFLSPEEGGRWRL